MLPSVFPPIPSFADLGAWTAAQLIPVFQSFRGDNVAPALALLIFSVAVMLCILFLLDAFRIWAQISRRVRSIRKVKTKTEFATALPNIEKLMLGSKYLRHSWEKFRETLIDPRDNQPEFRSTVRPQIYFNAVDAGLRFPIFRAMPNLLVGIGLLLTFFGLVSALYFTTDAINKAHDLAASQEALKDLLHAASFKFYTSIAGLAGSILMTLVLRYGTSKIDTVFDVLSGALENKLVSVTSESIAVEHYEEAKEQTRNLRLFNTEVAVSIGRHIEQALSTALPNQLAQALAPLTASLSEVAGKLKSMNEGAIKELAETFTQKLEAKTGEHLQSLATTLGNLTTSLEDLNRRLANSGAGLAQNVTSSGETIRNVVDSMAQTAQSIRDAGAPLAQASRLMTDGLQRIVDATRSTEQTVVAAQNEIREIGTTLRATLESTARQWENYERRFQGVDESLGSVLDKITRTVQTSVDTMKEFVTNIDDKFSGAIDKLGGGIEELTEFAQSIEQATHRLNGGNGQRIQP